jgi:hypothetical protein
MVVVVLCEKRYDNGRMTEARKGRSRKERALETATLPRSYRRQRAMVCLILMVSDAVKKPLDFLGRGKRPERTSLLRGKRVCEIFYRRHHASFSVPSLFT